MINVNETHDQNLKSWIESANDPNTDFPIQNLPFCKYIENDEERIGIAIGIIFLILNHILIQQCPKVLRQLTIN